MSAGKLRDDRVRIWQFIAYPESAGSDPWRVLRDFHTPFVVSPLHDKDVNSDGSIKKAHWHVIFLFDGKHSYEQVKAISDSIHAAPPERVLNVRGAIRYLIHLDDPDKYPYHFEELKCFCGADVSSYFAFSQKQIDDGLQEIENYIVSHNITRFSDLIEYARNTEPVWIYIIRFRSTNYLCKYIQDRRERALSYNKVKQIQADQDGVVNV